FFLAEKYLKLLYNAPPRCRALVFIAAQVTPPSMLCQIVSFNPEELVAPNCPPAIYKVSPFIASPCNLRLAIHGASSFCKVQFLPSLVRQTCLRSSSVASGVPSLPIK